MGILLLVWSILLFFSAGVCWERKNHVELIKTELKQASIIYLVLGLGFIIAMIGHYGELSCD